MCSSDPTGVHRNFAVGNGSLVVPDGWQPAAESGDWQVFPLSAKHPGWVVTHKGPGISLFAVVPGPEKDPEALLASVQALNPEPAKLGTRFAAPAGTEYTYDTNARRGTWVIETVDGRKVDRDYQTWPRLQLIDQ